MEGSSGYDVTTAPEIDMKPKAYEHGTYRYNQLLQVTGGQTVTLNDNSTATSVFEIPAKVLNLSKSILRFRMDQLDAPAGAVSFANIHCKGYPMIDRISLFTRTGVYICDLVNCNYYTNLVAPYVVSTQELARTPVARPELFYTINALVNNVVIDPAEYRETSTPVTNIACPSRNISPAPNSQQFGVPFANQPDNVINAEFGNMTYEIITSLGFIGSGIRYRLQGVGAIANDGAGGAYGQTLSQQYSIPLGTLPNSIFALNRDLFFGETMLMQIYWAPLNKFYYTTGPLDSDIATRPVFQLNRLALYLACETNRGIAESVVRQVASAGMRFTVPYVYTNRYSSPGGSQVSVQIRLNRGHGKNLLMVYNGIYNPLSTTNARKAYSCKSKIKWPAATTGPNVDESLNAPFWDYVYTMLDNERLQEINMTTIDDVDHTFQKENLVDSVAAETSIYNYNWAWIDNWTGLPTTQSNYSAFAECGLDLQQERLYTFVTSLNALAIANGTYPYNQAGENVGYGPINVYQFIITQKTLTITPTQISIV